MVNVSAVIPAHNEMNSIADVVRSCKEYCDEVIVVDDGSTDGTFSASRAAGGIVIRNKTNLGIVRSTQIGLRSASGDIIVTLDANGQHDPSEIPIIVGPIAQGLADLVLGKRQDGRPLSEQIISKLCSLRVKCEDVGTGYRAFRRDLAHKIRLWGFCLCGSLVLEAQRQGARIAEVPITTNRRKFGKSHWASSASRGTTHYKQALFLLCELISHHPLDADIADSFLDTYGQTGSIMV
jgi:glycosyltransferase involved in cell wall biosynthesis